MDGYKTVNLILHIPHSGTDIPFSEEYILSQSEIDAEAMLLTDWYVDELFNHENSIKVMADFSRVYCDVERFANDSHEVMSELGMGVVYTHSDDGRFMRKMTPGLREKIIQKYYIPHHHRLKGAVEMSLRATGKALLIDCHSFTHRPLKRDIDQSPNRPDICIGTDEYHTDNALVIATVDYFSGKGLSIELNRPYSGTIIPQAYYRKTKAVQSIMIEINRRLYLHEGTNVKSKHFPHIQAIIEGYLHYMEALYL